jgi:hypothetical protein
VDGLREHDWVPVAVEEQRIRNEARRGFQKHLIRFRRAEQMETLDEWNTELVLLKLTRYRVRLSAPRRNLPTHLRQWVGAFQFGVRSRPLPSHRPRGRGSRASEVQWFAGH